MNTAACACESADGGVHRPTCPSPRGAAQQLLLASGHKALTPAESDLVLAISYLIRGRLGEHSGRADDIALGELGRDMIRRAVTEIDEGEEETS